MKKQLEILAVVFVMLGSNLLLSAESGVEGKEHNENEADEPSVELTSQQLALANIRIEKLTASVMDAEVYAPGEILANGYTSYQVSPRVDSVVLRRHVALGDQVEAGQSLVTLFSEVVAEAQAEFRVASSEWQRVKSLGRKTVGDKRYVSTQADYDFARARLVAYGLSNEAVEAVVNKPSSLGEYTLIAANGGAVLSDDFHQGQRVAAGQPLMELADEKELWVEARLAPGAGLELPAGTSARIKVGERFYPAEVTQEAHTIDPVTRTRVIRLLVANDQHLLHPGMFADVYFFIATKSPVLAVPETALMRSDDGDWTVFAQTGPDTFSPREVTLGRQLGAWREISGIATGTMVVVEGAFFVASQLAKSGFDPHGH